jgi:hypothetical protein
MVDRGNFTLILTICLLVMLTLESAFAMSQKEFYRRCPIGGKNPNHDSMCVTDDPATWCGRAKGSICEPDRHPCCMGLTCVVPAPARDQSGICR